MAERGLDYLQSDTKRSFDVLTASATTVVLSPVMAGIGAAAVVDNRSADILFSQGRVGGHGESQFDVLKVRTLTKNLGNQAVSKIFGPFDPRARTIGRIMRRAGFDETPQFINILQGHMSMVGPRPLPQDNLELYEAADPKLFEEWLAYFQVVKPGLTGKSQIYRHHYRTITDEMIAHSMRLDLNYFESATLGEDVKCFGLTPIRLLRANMYTAEGNTVPIQTNIS